MLKTGVPDRDRAAHPAPVRAWRLRGPARHPVASRCGAISLFEELHERFAEKFGLDPEVGRRAMAAYEKGGPEAVLEEMERG